MPNNRSPLKQHVSGPDRELKIKMLEVGLETLRANGIDCKILDCDLKKEGPAYTIDSMVTVRKENPDAEFYLLIGLDQFEKFDQWKSYKVLLKSVNLIVTSRPGYRLPSNRDQLPGWLKPLVQRYAKDRILLKTKKSLLFVQLNDVQVSATEIRRKIRRKENVTHLTPSPVIEFLVSNKVYDGSEVLVSDYKEFTQFCARVVNDKGGIAVNAYDVRQMVQPSEFTLVASGTSQRHTRALGEHIVREAKTKYGIDPQNVEGEDEGRWVVLDYGPLIIHLFYDFVRNEYRIEDLWSKAGPMKL